MSKEQEKIEIEYLTSTEEMVLNPEYRGLRQARIEVYIKGKTFPEEVGHIRVWNDDELFAKVIDLIHYKKE